MPELTHHSSLITGAEIAAAALSLVGVRYAHQGRVESLGIDCAGVVVAAFKKCGVELREEKVNYRRLPAEAHISRCLEMNFELSPFADTVFPGDIVHLRLKRDTAARHLGIIVAVTTMPSPGELMIVHAVRRDACVRLDTFSGLLQTATIAGIYQWPRLQS